MRRSIVEQKIDILRTAVQNPEWAYTRVMNTANIAPARHKKFVNELVEAGLISIKASVDKRELGRLITTDEGEECIRKWDELIKIVEANKWRTST